MDPFRAGSRKVPCKHLDRFQTVPCQQKPIRSGLVRDGSGPVPCKHSPRLRAVSEYCFFFVTTPTTAVVCLFVQFVCLFYPFCLALFFFP